MAPCVQASGCELNALFGLRLGSPVAPELIERKFEEDNAGIVRFFFRPRTGEPGFAPLQAFATGRKYFLTSIAGVHTASSAEEAKVFLAKTLGELSEKHRCSFRADRNWIGTIADVTSRDAEAHVSIDSATVVGLQRDGARVVLKLRMFNVFNAVAKDPPE
ncbi:MAG TPA: hypothetical protein VKE95_19120 [Burkholderiales bacterium]|nr:hypothetical protein [Burkholderiales bacterium]